MCLCDCAFVTSPLQSIKFSDSEDSVGKKAQKPFLQVNIKGIDNCEAYILHYILHYKMLVFLIIIIQRCAFYLCVCVCFLHHKLGFTSFFSNKYLYYLITICVLRCYKLKIFPKFANLFFFSLIKKLIYIIIHLCYLN